MKQFWLLDTTDGEWHQYSNRKDWMVRVNEIESETGFKPDTDEEDDPSLESFVEVKMPARKGGSTNKVMSSSKAAAVKRHGDKVVLNDGK